MFLSTIPVFWFSLQGLSGTFLILRRIQRDIVINIHIFMRNSRYSSHIVMNLEFSRQIFEKQSNIKFHEKCVQFEQSCSIRKGTQSDRGTDGRADEQIDRDRQTEMMKRIVAFRNFENVPKKNGSWMETVIKLTNQMFCVWWNSLAISIKLKLKYM